MQMPFRLARCEMQTVRGIARLHPRDLSRAPGVSMRARLDRTAVSDTNLRARMQPGTWRLSPTGHVQMPRRLDGAQLHRMRALSRMRAWFVQTTMGLPMRTWLGRRSLQREAHLLRRASLDLSE